MASGVPWKPSANRMGVWLWIGGPETSTPVFHFHFVSFHWAFDSGGYLSSNSEPGWRVESPGNLPPRGSQPGVDVDAPGNLPPR